jgi:hypothetical protein
MLRILSVGDKIKSSIYSKDNCDNVHMDYLFRVFKNPFPNLIFDCTSTKEIAKIMKALKSKTHLVRMKFLSKF